MVTRCEASDNKGTFPQLDWPRQGELYPGEPWVAILLGQGPCQDLWIAVELQPLLT